MSEHTLVLVPTRDEREGLGHIPGDMADVRVSGMGKVATALAVSRAVLDGYENVVLAGLCGGILGCSLGDLLIPSTVIDGDFDPGPAAQDRNRVMSATQQGAVEAQFVLTTSRNGRWATIVSQDQFAVQVRSSGHGFSGQVPLATDMESFAFVQSARFWKMPYAIVRVVSDIVGKNAGSDFALLCRRFSPHLRDHVLAATEAIQEAKERKNVRP